MLKKFCIWVACIGFLLAILLPKIKDAKKGPKVTSELTQKVCRAAIATIFSKPIDIIKIRKVVSDIVYMEYIREEDSTRWQTKCYLEGGRVIWGSEGNGTSGRWRTAEFDPVVTWSVNNSVITITDKISDTSKNVKSYNL
ncbi:hypothetical protein [Pseudoalteromonas rubra]|uniref:hypothetical protein n=1 Tax=Pseudoalteromonas rubra TaxID=43658 RepID=UPI000F76AB2B|nr:hypothetical protein [Pseudoalteromonas rubra]